MYSNAFSSNKPTKHRPAASTASNSPDSTKSSEKASPPAHSNPRNQRNFNSQFHTSLLTSLGILCALIAILISTKPDPAISLAMDIRIPAQTTAHT